MWLEKLFSGVLRVLTPLGPRYLNPSFGQRLYLIWIFRHFETLPVKVLSSRQRRMIELMCANNQFITLAFDDIPVLGTLEQRPPVPEPKSPRRASSSVRDSVGPITADAQQ
ncbi:MAG TPA: hypothetical protein VH596_14100 [Terriglobales bacterium]|jgi:hypothetical protein